MLLLVHAPGSFQERLFRSAGLRLHMGLKALRVSEETPPIRSLLLKLAFAHEDNAGP